MSGRSRYPIRRPVTGQRWLALAGYLLAAWIALSVPGTASFDHLDAIFSPHQHDPITRAVLPWDDPTGHPITAEPTGDGPAVTVPTVESPAGSYRDSLPGDPLLPAPLAGPVIRLTLAQPGRPLGRHFGPTPPPPRA